MDDDVAAVARGIRAGERRALARGITWLESTRRDDRDRADALLAELVGDTGGAIRVGISGTPGVGKSTFVESLGLLLVEAGHRVAVLAVDPSSHRSGGSILGDRTRMVDLGRSPSAFIRSTPSRGRLGGVAAGTRDTVALVEAAGHDVVLVETVGVGQSETAVASVSDVFLLLVAPGGGDDLQGIKRGVLELADVVAINKADGDGAGPAARTADHYRSALHLVRPKHPGRPTPVRTCSGQTGLDVDEVWRELTDLWGTMRGDGSLASLRRDQRVAAVWEAVDDRIRRRLAEESDLDAIVAAAADGSTTVGAAASRIVARLAPSDND